MMELDKIISRLESFAYSYVEENDGYTIEYIKNKVLNHVLNETNQVEVPEQLENVAIDMICVEFLRLKKGMGQLESIEFERIEASVSMGDTSISYVNDGTPEQKFDSMLNSIYASAESELIKHRKLVW